MKVSKTQKGFHVGKSDKEVKIETLKNKGNPTNKEIMELLLEIHERIVK